LPAQEALAETRKVEIKARKIVNTLLQSRYRSIFRGRGMEFSEVREYQYGDEVRHIDWNVTARTGKLHVKKFTEERDLLIYIVLDVSPSTSFGSLGLKKDKGALVASTLSYSAFKGNDRVGAVFFSWGVEKALKPGKSRASTYLIAREALKPRAAGGTYILPPLNYLSRVLRERALVFFISDFISPDLEGGFEKLRELARRGNDVVAIKLDDPRDYSLPEVGILEVEDPESGRQLTVDTSDSTLREEYSMRSLAREKFISSMVKRSGIDLIRISTQEDFYWPLVKFFMLREKRRRKT